MDDEEEESIREERRKKLSEALEQHKQQQQLEAMKKSVLMRILTPEAYERMMNIRMAKKELYEKAIEVLVYLYQNKKISETNRLGDQQLVALLSRMVQTKESRIEFRRKGE